MRKTLFAVCSLLSLVWITTKQASSQATATPATRLQFDAASVRPISAQQSRDEGFEGLHCRGVDGELAVLMSARGLATVPQGRCTGRLPVGDLVVAAYSSPASQFRMMNLPDEFEITGPASMLYQIQAVAANPSLVTKAELQQMLQTLLVDRFNFKAHRETRQLDGFALTVAKGGVKFKETPLDEEPCGGIRPQDEGAPRPPEGGNYPVMLKGLCGMKQFVRALASLLGGAPVADRTDLSGVYDITLRIEIVPALNPGGGRGGGGGGPQVSTNMPKALEDQLGLHLERAKVPVEFLFIDHIEKPTEN